MKSTRHTLLAVLVILVILIVLLTAAVETAPEIIIPPSNETVYSGDTKEFTCHTRNANYAEWKLNGTASLISSNDVTVSLNGGNIANGFNTTLTIKARLEYHGLVIKCVAVMVDGDTVVRMSKNAILMVQGLLDPVSDVKVKSGSDSILLSWRPPYSLNVTGVEPDIWYNIIITNITDDMPVPCSDCHNLTQPHYTFTTTNPSPCHKYNFTIISLNGAGEGGRSEPVETTFAGLFASNAREVTGNRTVDQGMQTLFLISTQNCFIGNETVVLYFTNTKSMQDCAMKATDEISLKNSMLTLPNNLPFDCKWNVTIETRTALDRVNTTGEITINTFEVLDASASQPTPPEPGMLIFTGNFTKYAGGCFIVVPDGGGPGQDKCILVKLQDTRSSATQSVTGFSKGIQKPRIYDLEKDGKVGERPAVIISSAMVEDGGDNQSNQSTDVLIDRASETTIIITLNKTEARSIHADELLVVWYDRDDVTYHLNSKMDSMDSTVNQISINISKERNYTVAVFCNSTYPCAIKTFEAIYTQSTDKTPTPSGEPEIEMQNMQPHVIISALVVTITITTTASSTVIVLIVIFRKRRKGKLFNLPQSIRDHEKRQIVNDGCVSDSNSSSTTSPPTKKKNPNHPEGVLIYTEVTPISAGSVKPLISNEPSSQYATIMPSTVPAEASDTQHTEPVIPEKTKIVLISPENVKAMLWPAAKKWKEIVEALGLSEDILDEVYTNNETDECCMENAIELWVKYHGLSWEKLATVLRGVGEEALANKCQAHHDVNDSLSEEAPPLPPPYVPRGQEIQITSETPFQQTTLLGEEKYFTKEGNVAAEQTCQQLMECGVATEKAHCKMNIVEGENGKLLFATDGYTPPPLNDNDEDAIRRKDQMETTIERSFEPFIKSSQRFVSNCGRPGNEEVNAKSRGPMFTNSPCVSVPESYKRPSQLVAFNTYFNAQLTVLPPNEIHTPEQHSCGPVMQVTEEEMPPTAKYCFTPFSLKKLENDPKSDTCEIDCMKAFESSDSYEMEFDCMQLSLSSPSEDEDTQETEPSIAKMEGGQENESSLPEDKDAQETESSLPEMGGGQMKISDDVPDTPGTQLQLHTSFPTEQIFGLAAVVSIVWSAMKIFNWKYAPWERGRTVLSCLWKNSGRNGKDAGGCGWKYEVLNRKKYPKRKQHHDK